MEQINLQLTPLQKIYIVKQEWFFFTGIMTLIIFFICLIVLISNIYSLEGYYILSFILFVLLASTSLTIFLTNKKAGTLEDGIIVTATIVQSHKHKHVNIESILPSSSYSVDYEYNFEDNHYLINLPNDENHNFSCTEKLIIDRRNPKKHILVKHLPIEVIEKLRTTS